MSQSSTAEKVVDLSLISQKKVLFSGKVYSVCAQTDQGGIEILPQHIPLICILQPGVLRIKTANNNTTAIEFLIEGGLLNVQPGKINILTDTGINTGEMSASELEDAIFKSKERLRKQQQIDFAASLTELSALSTQQRVMREIGKIRER